MPERGEIRNKNYASILNSFVGMERHRKITPTDIDGVIDYNGEVFIFLEGKYNDSEMPKGQKYCLEHICDAINDGGKYAICLVFSHYCGPNEIVQVSECTVTKVYTSKKWVAPKKKESVLSFIKRIEDYFQNNLGIKI